MTASIDETLIIGDTVSSRYGNDWDTITDPDGIVTFLLQPPMFRQQVI